MTVNCAAANIATTTTMLIHKHQYPFEAAPHNSVTIGYQNINQIQYFTVTKTPSEAQIAVKSDFGQARSRLYEAIA